MGKVARVAVIDDHPLFRAGIRQAFEATFDLEVVSEGADAQDALEIADTNEHDMMLLDLNIPGGGMDTARALTKSHPDMKIVILTNSEDIEDLASVMQLGAFGYIVKGIAGSELVDILRQVHQGEAYVTPNLAASALRMVAHAKSAAVSADAH
jgi:two-component system, NarL family, nitrate/nitrite response regulator NarL